LVVVVVVVISQEVLEALVVVADTHNTAAKVHTIIGQAEAELQDREILVEQDLVNGVAGGLVEVGVGLVGLVALIQGAVLVVLVYQ
jgi:hypothetical protein